MVTKTMKRLLILMLFLGGAAGQAAAQVMPVWLAPFPGATPENKRTDTTVASSYSVAALPKDVLSHFQKAFDAQGIPIDSIGAPEGFYLHAEAPECNLEISIVRSDKATAVKVTCTSKVGTVQRIVAEPAPDMVDEKPENPMKKFDKPVPPDAKAALIWPVWLVRVDGARLSAQKVAGLLKSSFTAAGPRADIDAFYTDLLDTNSYQVTKGLPMGPDDSGTSLQGSSEPDAKTGKKTVIRIKIRPDGGDFHVEITMQ